MAAKDVKDFNEWFNRSYEKLKERISIYYGKIDEDVFHDVYLAVRKQVMFSREGIENREAYFSAVTRAGTRDNSRYSCPGDGYFITLG